MYDAHELEVHRNPPLSFIQKRYVSAVERSYARRADSVITVGNLLRKELERHLGRSDIEVVYNSPRISTCPSNIRDDLKISDSIPLILYVGKITEGRGIRKLIDIVRQVPNAVLAAVGPSDPRSKAVLIDFASQAGMLNRFHILPPVPFDQVVDYVRGATVGVISVEPVTLSYRYCMPNKLFELSFAEVPIVSNFLDEVSPFLEEIGNGLSTDFDRHDLVAYSISKMIIERHKFVKSADADNLSQYTWDQQISKLILTYERLLQDRAA